MQFHFWRLRSSGATLTAAGDLFKCLNLLLFTLFLQVNAFFPAIFQHTEFHNDKPFHRYCARRMA